MARPTASSCKPSRSTICRIQRRRLARYLQRAGYLTALVGKWHLGDADHYPETHGFDVNIGGTRWGAPQSYFWPYSGTRGFGGEFRYVPHLEFGSSGEYLTDRLTDEASRVLDRVADAKQPFFLYLAHHAPAHAHRSEACRCGGLSSEGASGSAASKPDVRRDGSQPR